MQNIVFIRKYKPHTYTTRMWVVVSMDLEKAVSVVEDQTHYSLNLGPSYLKSADVITSMIIDHDGSQRIFIFIRPTVSNGRVAHEANHAMNYIFSHHGVKLSLTNDEHQCYYLEMIVDRIYRALDRFIKKSS